MTSTTRQRRRPPTAGLKVERALFEEGHRLVAGIDEVGRGAWAGPLVVGVVVVDATTRRPPKGTRDSKLLTAIARESLVASLEPWCVSWSLGEVSAHEIDVIGLSAALTMGASRALGALPEQPDAVIVDGTYDFISPKPTDVAAELSRVECAPVPRVVTLAKADRIAASVAAASILAKVRRDATMRSLSSLLPGFGFERHKGYGTREHASAIGALGVSREHRHSWSFALDERERPERISDLASPG